MARIVGVDIPNDKQVGFSLTYIYGIGRTTATKICEAAKGVDFLAPLKPNAPALDHARAFP